jgi:transcriptional regulator with XRE-family HTH domain
MRLNGPEIRRRCRERGLALSELLREAGVSRTAYYSLEKRRRVIPRSVEAVARALRVPAATILTDADDEKRRARARLETAKRVLDRHPDAEFDNVWHTLVLLDEPPVERLRRALTRGRAGRLLR